MQNGLLVRRIICLMLAICMFLGCCPAQAAKPEDAQPYPDALQITIARDSWKSEEGYPCETALPVTCVDSVNQELANAQEELLLDLAQHITSKKQTMEQEATYRISGTRWAGFLLVGRVIDMLDNPAREGEKTETTIYLNYRVFAYDMETGEALTLSDVFPEDSDAWNQIATLMNERYSAYYSHLTKDQNAIDEYCSIETLKEMPFLPSAGRLTLVTPLEDALADHWQLIHTILPYPDFRPVMTETAYQQTDNSHRRIIAITYDDGPTNDQTPKILRSLNNYGANATFFCVGRQVEYWTDMVRRELDYGHTVGSHTYKHRYDFQVNGQYLIDDRQQCLQLHRELTGLEPPLFRAPGGNYEGYLKHEVGWPIIMWHYSAGDTGNNNAYQLADRIYNFATDGDIVLMHDMYYKTAKGSEMFLSRLAADGFLFASVDELLYLYGYTIEPNTVYYDAYSEPVTEWKDQ